MTGFLLAPAIAPDGSLTTGAVVLNPETGRVVRARKYRTFHENARDALGLAECFAALEGHTRVVGEQVGKDAA